MLARGHCWFSRYWRHLSTLASGWKALRVAGKQSQAEYTLNSVRFGHAPLHRAKFRKHDDMD
jgi:hypothetical protein